MKLGNLGTQIAIKSEKAFHSIRYEDSNLVNSAKWYPAKISFNQINDSVRISDIFIMYDKYHEMDIDQFVIEMDRRRRTKRILMRPG